MKKVMLSIAVITLIVVTSCKNENKEAEESKKIALTEYQCPMKCEGDKTYTDKDMKCPICGMSLKQVEAVMHDSDEDHDKHDH